LGNCVAALIQVLHDLPTPLVLVQASKRVASSSQATSNRSLQEEVGVVTIAMGMAASSAQGVSSEDEDASFSKSCPITTTDADPPIFGSSGVRPNSKVADDSGTWTAMLGVAGGVITASSVVTTFPVEGSLKQLK